MNQKKLDFLRENVGFHLSDLSYARQLEFKARPEAFAWKLLALSRDKIENWELYGFRYFDNPDFRKTVDNSLAVLEKEDEKTFNEAMRQERRRKGVWVEAAAARRKYRKIKMGLPYEFIEGTTEKDKQYFNELMASTNTFEEQSEEDYFTLWSVAIIENFTIGIPERKEEELKKKPKGLTEAEKREVWLAYKASKKPPVPEWRKEWDTPMWDMKKLGER